MERHVIDIDRMPWQQFEELCGKILEQAGFKNVVVISSNYPVIDIRADYVQAFPTGGQRLIRWGVQAKQGRFQFEDITPVGPHARVQPYQAFLGIASKGFAPRVLEYVEVLEKDWGLQQVDLWDAGRVLTRVLDNEPLIDLCFAENQDETRDSSDRQEELVRTVAELTGLDRAMSVMIAEEIRSLRDQRERVRGGDPRTRSEFVSSTGPGHNPKYLTVLHKTAILFDNQPVGAYTLIDRVSSKRVHRELSFTFLFTTSTETWDISYNVAKNEYTHLIPLTPAASLEMLNPFVQVKMLRVDDCTQFEYDRRLTSDAIIVVAVPRRPPNSTGPHTVEYEVRTPKKANQRYCNTLHVQSDAYEQQLRFSPPLPLEASVEFLKTRREEVLELSRESGSISIRSNTAVYPGAGIAVTWESDPC